MLKSYSYVKPFPKKDGTLSYRTITYHKQVKNYRAPCTEIPKTEMSEIVKKINEGIPKARLYRDYNISEVYNQTYSQFQTRIKKFDNVK